MTNFNKCVHITNIVLLTKLFNSCHRATFDTTEYSMLLNGDHATIDFVHGSLQKKYDEDQARPICKIYDGYINPTSQ